MSDTPINLNRARKARAREAAKRAADENAVRFGRTKTQRTVEIQEAQNAARRHEGQRREE